MAKAGRLKDKDGVTRYPITISEMVYDNDNGKTVANEISEINQDVTEINEKVGNLSVVDGCLCVTYNN